jgi:4-amino-4-deoxy-L-arabinose transferase-like glycosyltransferase
MARISTVDRSDEDARYGLWLAGVLGLLLAVRVVALRYNGTDLFFDEAQYWYWSREPAFGYYSKPPLIAWVIGLATSVCGDSEFCVRLPAPLIHTATALGVYGLGRRLYDVQTGFWSALVFATLPGVSLSSGIISTDVPLLFFWVVALIGLTGLLDGRAWWPALLVGVALGLGLNAKYAMAYFVLCLAVYLIATPDRRRLLADPRLWVALAIAGVLIAPNLAWNASNSFATFAHTADNAKWGGPLLHPGKAAEFFLAQFGVFGPILFASLLVILVRAWRHGVPPADRLLLAFSVPIVAVVLVQAFLSRAHANWAALAYVAGTILVTATLIRDLTWGWLRATLAIHLVVMAALGLGMAAAGRVGFPPWASDPFERTLGWRALADATRKVVEEEAAAGRPLATIITDDRSTSAELLYYLPSHAKLLKAWRSGPRPNDHFEMTRPFGAQSPLPALLVELRPESSNIRRRFGQAHLIARTSVATSPGRRRDVAFYRLSDYRGP